MYSIRKHCQWALAAASCIIWQTFSTSSVQHCTSLHDHAVNNSQSQQLSQSGTHQREHCLVSPQTWLLKIPRSPPLTTSNYQDNSIQDALPVKTWLRTTHCQTCSASSSQCRSKGGAVKQALLLWMGDYWQHSWKLLWHGQGDGAGHVVA